jgi:hypothetical protein
VHNKQLVKALAERFLVKKMPIEKKEFGRLKTGFVRLGLFESSDCHIQKSSVQAMHNTEQRRAKRDYEKAKKRFPSLEILEEKIGYDDAKKVFGIFNDLVFFRSYAPNLMNLCRSKESRVDIITKRQREWHIDTSVAHLDMILLQKYGLFGIVERMSHDNNYNDMLEQMCKMIKTKK